MHKSGFVNIIGHPNVGKSTLMNALIGERLSIINPKAQTTRHRILGIWNDEGHQIVFSDTPGIIEPAYKLQEGMMGFVNEALTDADIFLFMVETGQRNFKNENLLEKLRQTEARLFLIVNKVDLGTQEKVEEDFRHWQEMLPNISEKFALSATLGFNVKELLEKIKENLPEGPEYYPKDQLTDKSERFIAAEIIREKILTHYEQEIPYSVEVQIEAFKEEAEIIRIRALILVARDSQKSILIGRQGSKLKTVGTQARRDMEKFFGKKIFLETYVKVDKNWREDPRKLKRYGYFN